MKKHKSILTYLGAWWHVGCWCALIVGLTSDVNAAMPELTAITLEHGDSVNTVSFSPDGTLLVTGSSHNIVMVWEILPFRSEDMDPRLLLEHDDSVNAVSFSPDGTLLATGSSDNTAKVWELLSGNLLATLEHDGSVNAVSFSPDGRSLATGASDNTARVWKILPFRSEDMDPRLLLEHDDSVNAVLFSPDGTLLATGSSDNTVKVWEISSGELLATLEHDDSVNAVSFSPDGRSLVTGASDNTARVWKILPFRSEDMDLRLLLEHDDSVNAVSFSPDGTLLATGSSDNIVKVWEISSGNLLATLEHDDSVNAVSFSPDGRFLATGSSDNTAKIWAQNIDDLLAPSHIEPLDDSEFANALPELEWEQVPNVWSYQVQVAEDRDFSHVKQETTTDTELLKVTMGPFAPGEYFWRVRTIGWNFGEWSVPWSFTVDFTKNILNSPDLNVTMTELDFETKDQRNITLQIKIDKAQNLYGFQFTLKFDPDVLEAIKVTEGDFLRSVGGNSSFLRPTIDNRTGVIKNVVATRVNPGEVEGSGVLAEIEFNFKKAGTSPIIFTLVKLSNEHFQPINYTYVNGSVTLNIMKTTMPSAKIQVEPSIVDNKVVAKVLIKDAVNLRGYSVDLEYPSAFELLDVSRGDFLKENWQQTTPSANTVRFSASKVDGKLPVEGSGEIATLTFRIWEGGEQAFTLTNGTLTSPAVTDVYTPELEDGAITVVASPNWEINKDYVVDVQDIVVLGINFGEQVTDDLRPNPDVTRDGLVNMFDLAAVASHYRDEYSAIPQLSVAPSVILNHKTLDLNLDIHYRKSFGKYCIMKGSAHGLPKPTASQCAVLQNLYNRVERYPDTDVYPQGIHPTTMLAVKQLLASLIENVENILPQGTQLAQNYPNPFNPETWIPFELSEAADVKIKIYDAKGQLIRTLALGQKSAGFYFTQKRAAYWNGRNFRGEQVASGVYFYTLTAGTFIATRRLMVLK